MLNLSVREEPEVLELVPAETRRIPAVALAWSLVFPGLGHWYVGLRENAAKLAGFTVLGLLLVGFGAGRMYLHGMLMVPTLYCFGVLDAYFAAMEWNAGATDRMTGQSPRIAALLNFLTKGFGYFYLGERTKGFICFAVVSLMQGALAASGKVWLSILAITLQVAIAIDVYRVARVRLLETNPELRGDAVKMANPEGLQPAVAMGIGVVLGGAFVLSYGTMGVLNGRTITAGGAIERSGDGLKYVNRSEGVSFSGPADWESDKVDGALVELSMPGCSAILLDQYSMAAMGDLVAETKTSILTRHPQATITSPVHHFGTKVTNGFDASFVSKDGVAMTQSYLSVRRGAKVFSLVETSRGAECEAGLGMIEKTFRM